jgi:hypothetical protein
MALLGIKRVKDVTSKGHWCRIRRECDTCIGLECAMRPGRSVWKILDSLGRPALRLKGGRLIESLFDCRIDGDR